MDEEQFEYIKRIIDDSDYYLLIIGGRYGSVDENGVSWTEKEYNYAVSKEIPVLVFDHKDFTKLPADKTDQDDKKREKLVAFKKNVSKKRLIKYWTDVNDLDAVVAKSLHKVLEKHERIGWVRDDMVTSLNVQTKIDKLNNEIAGYKEEVEKLKADLKKKNDDFCLINNTNQAAQQDIKTLQRKIDQLQKECDELRAKQQKSNEDRLAIEEFYKEKVKYAESELEKILDKLNVSITDTITVPGTNVSFNMVLVDGGKFMMGAKKGDASDDKKPARQVTLSDFWIGETQVTQALWKAVMGENPSYYNDDPNLPVEQVSWNDCQLFIKELNRLTGRAFHLPTEVQWEFAARGGNKSKGYKYAGSNDIKKVAWYSENSGRKTHAVAQKDPNEIGLYDMSGNVYEWCQDWLADPSGESDASPTDSAIETYRVGRGGGWVSNDGDCCVSYRGGSSPSFTRKYVGLRLAL